ncbi:hypothetical protein H5410_013453 [Solanum commersonii]|uniref:Cullin-like alpha+beta domain-containing protein n=1 Tax=Solanum commersonii TaxID=4109 RepID=A0A9J6AVF4_SOLCO|nr:hypothetical protein H5410_013453 [Solanum commersonii]
MKPLKRRWRRKRLTGQMLFNKSANDEHERINLTKLRQQCGGSSHQRWREFIQGVLSNKRKHRKLTWIYSLGTCNINGKFEPKIIDLVFTTYQIELLGNHDAIKPINDVVVRLLHSLSYVKYKILNKEPHTKIISLTDVFEFNSKFIDKMRRIKVIEDIDKDIQYAIDASSSRGGGLGG